MVDKNFDSFIDNSNIGKINMRVGGSTRNAAECLLRLGYHGEL